MALKESRRFGVVRKNAAPVLFPQVICGPKIFLFSGSASLFLIFGNYRIVVKPLLSHVVTLEVH